MTTMKKVSLHKIIKLYAGGMGAMLIAVGDWIIGYISPKPLGTNAILLEGCKNISFERCVVSMAFCFIGAMLLIYGMLYMEKFILKKYIGFRKSYSITALFGALPWLFIHFVVCGFRYQYQYLYQAGYSELAYDMLHNTYEAFTPLIYLSMIIMVVPHILYFMLLITKKTVFPRYLTWLYLFTFVIIFNLIAIFFDGTSLAQGILTSANNMAIAIWFCVSGTYIAKTGKYEVM